MPYFHPTPSMATASATATEEHSQESNNTPESSQHQEQQSNAPQSSQEEERVHRIRIKNRRKYYLDTHPSYFSSDLELADPLLYDRLIRRYQSASEREAEGRAKGYSGILEADLVRSEAKIEALTNPDPNSLWTYRRGENGEILAEEKDEMPLSKEEARKEWEDVMRWRFLKGEDRDFDYKSVDENDRMDDLKEEDRDREEAYFDSVDDGDDGLAPEEGRELKGETGIQDF